MSDQQRKTRDEMIRAARERYGKPFAHEVRVQRTTRQSYLLSQLNRRSAKNAGSPVGNKKSVNVVLIGRGKKCQSK